MATLKGWKSLLAYLEEASLLEYVFGFRHPVKQGVLCGMHAHPTIEVVYHAVGSGHVRLSSKRSLAFPERSVVIHAPEESHDQILDVAGEDICIHIAVPHAVRLDGAGAICIEKVEGLAILQDIEFLGRGYFQPYSPVGFRDPSAQEIEFQKRGRFQPVRSERVILNLRASTMLLSLLREAAMAPSSGEHSQTDEARIQRAEKYMQEHYQAIDSIQSIAAETGIGYDHLRHCFKTLRGKSLICYLTEIRVERAKSLLIHAKLSVKEIAALCGFREEYYFSAVFKNFIGLSPLHYRRRYGSSAAK